MTVAKTDILRDKSIVGSPYRHLLSLFVVLFAFWLLLSGTLELKFVIYGVLTSVAVAWITYPLLLVSAAGAERRYFILSINPFKLINYFFWLMYQLVMANIDVVSSTVRPELSINPGVCRFRFVSENPLAEVVLANSITLTPGTVTMNVTDDGIYEVHALTDNAAEGLLAGGMQKKVAWLFGEKLQYEPMGEEF